MKSLKVKTTATLISMLFLASMFTFAINVTPVQALQYVTYRITAWDDPPPQNWPDDVLATAEITYSIDGALYHTFGDTGEIRIYRESFPPYPHITVTWGPVEGYITPEPSSRDIEGFTRIDGMYHPPIDSSGPITYAVLASPNPASVKGDIILTATVDDTDTGGSTIASAEYKIDDIIDWTGMAAVDGTFDDHIIEPVTATITAGTLLPGVYTVYVRGTDSLGNTGPAEEAEIPLVVYDPEGGFVTGGGWINSPEGADSEHPTQTGKATFGFVSKYKKGASMPTGQTEFVFKAGDLNFHSSSYDWLVITGHKAMYKGVGTINGEGTFKFILSAIDGDLNGDGPDKFRIKIWVEDTNGDILRYDNKVGETDDYADPTTEIGGGSIVIHKGKK